ncbi:type II toxin-antitoxin system HicA family toxin [Pseudoduganella sp. LjRoot289]|uniref:type II toxin-antitoxin system HicA family toxin n=1 Tax=Pseudoduganella sp. LjRoot289 TaxID=3342314 RepID=UPI003ED03CA4
MRTKHEKLLRAVFTSPTSASILYSDLEGLLVAPGGQVRAGAGSRVVLQLGGRHLHQHRPHPGKEAKRYQVEEIRALLLAAGYKP